MISSTAALRSLAAGPLGVPLGLIWARSPVGQVPAIARPLQEKYSAYQSTDARRYLIFATLLLLLPGMFFIWPFSGMLDG